MQFRFWKGKRVIKCCSNEIGEAVKYVSGNFEETGNEKLEIKQQFKFHTTTLCMCEYKGETRNKCESDLSSQELKGQRFPASVSLTITQRILVVNHSE